MADDSWRTAAFRQSVVHKIDEAIRVSGMATSRNSVEMENHVYQKAKSKEEYLGFVARLILHVREMSTKKTGMSGPNQSGPGQPDPLNALQTLASQGTRNNQIMHMGMGQQGGPMGQQQVSQNATNLLQTLNRPNAGNMQSQMAGNMPGAMSGNMGAQMTGNVGGGGMPANMQGPMGPGSGLQNPGMPGQMMNIGMMQASGMPRPQQQQNPNMSIGPSGVPQQMGGTALPMVQNPNLQPQQQQQLQQMQASMANQQHQQQQNQVMSNQMQMSGGPMQVGQMQGGPIQQGAAMQQVGQMPGNQMGTGGQMPVGQIQGGQMANAQMQGGPMQAGSMQGGPIQGGSMQAGQIQSNPIHGQIGMTMGNQIPNQMISQMIIGRKTPGDNMGTMMGTQVTGPGPASGGFPRNPTPNQFLTQPSPNASVPSPAAAPSSSGMTGPPSVGPPGGVGGGTSGPGVALATVGNQMIPSPALAPSPSPGMLTSQQQQQRSVGMAPSPSAPLNTPGQPGQSPMSDDQAYREKVRQLSKYIDPLRKMITRLGNEGEHMEKMSKMKKLLEILSNPNQRMPLDTLLKCEVVLEKLDFKRGDGSVPPPTSSSQLTMKEHHLFNPLLEAINNSLQSPVINHTLHRTFGPTLDALFSPEIKLIPPIKRKYLEESTNEIPDVLQGEIARLDTRFKVSLDPSQQAGSKVIHLTCWLDDKNLPCVPPVSLTVPVDYPETPPQCHMAAHEYNATQFLSAVQTALQSRISKLPRYFSVSQLLDTWEMSVRQASAPRNVPVSATTLLMGL